MEPSVSASYPEDRLSYLQGAYEQIDKRMDFFQHSLSALRDEMERRFDRVDRKFDRLESKFDGRFAEIDRRFAGIDGRFAEFDRKLGSLDAKFDGKFGSLQASLNATLRWSISSIVGVGVAIIAAVIAVH